MMNMTIKIYHQVVSTVREFNWKAVIKDNIILCEFCILYFDEKSNTIYLSPNMGGNYEREIEFLSKMLATVKEKVRIVHFAYHVYYDGDIVWNTNKDFIITLKNILEKKYTKVSQVKKLVIERKYGAPLELSRPDNSIINPMFG